LQRFGALPALLHELEERETSDTDYEDPFIADGLSSGTNSSSSSPPPPRMFRSHRHANRNLSAAKERREELKRLLFEMKAKLYLSIVSSDLMGWMPSGWIYVMMLRTV
jgi:hypothetical protein